MSAPDPVWRYEEARRWLVVADRDLHAAALCLKPSDPEPGAAAFLCQQAAEKLVKALLVAANVPFPKTHDISKLAELADPVWPAFAMYTNEFRALTPWNAEFRYPTTDPEEFPSREAVERVRKRLLAFRSDIERVATGWR